jgi:hypothetical protein
MSGWKQTRNIDKKLRTTRQFVRYWYAAAVFQGSNVQKTPHVEEKTT